MTEPGGRAHTGHVDLGLVLTALVVGAVGAVSLRRRGGATPGAPHKPVEPQRPRDMRAQVAAPDSEGLGIDDLDATFDALSAAHAHQRDVLLGARLSQLVQRRVPVRAIRRAPGVPAVRVCFADGTVVLCRGTGNGDFARLVLALPTQSVRLADYALDERGMRLEFRWRPDHRLAAVAVGLDQPD